MTQKVFVEVDAHFDAAGNIVPFAILWEDGRIFEIDKILDSRKAASLKAGGIGLRYTIKVNKKETYLWYEEPRWYVEGIDHN